MADAFQVFSIDMRVLDSGVQDASGRPLKISDAGPNDLVAPAGCTIVDLVAKIRQRAAGRPINRLTLICHGLGEMLYGDMTTGSWAPGQTVALPGLIRSEPHTAVCKIYGGYGLELGEGLDLRNVNDFRYLRGAFSGTGIILVCGCAAADTGPTLTRPSGEVLTGDGPKLMRALAAAASVSVVAAVRLQEVDQNWYLGTADRKPFVGPTYLFTPDGRQMPNAASY